MIGHTLGLAFNFLRYIQTKQHYMVCEQPFIEAESCARSVEIVVYCSTKLAGSSVLTYKSVSEAKSPAVIQPGTPDLILLLLCSSSTIFTYSPVSEINTDLSGLTGCHTMCSIAAATERNASPPWEP